MQLSGEIKFINNSGGEYSALHLDSFAQLVFMKGLNMLFDGNSGQSVQYDIRWILITFPMYVCRFGASILLEPSTMWSAHKQLVGNPLCPFLYEDKNTAPKNWENVHNNYYLPLHKT